MPSRETRPPTPRRHHFLPQFYLAGFTSSGERDGDLWALSIKDGRRWKGKPDTIGHERDFYRVDDVPGIEPDAVEQIFAKAESDIAPALQALLARHTLPVRGSREFDLLLNLVAGMLARVPRSLSILQNVVASIAMLFARNAVASPERLRAAVESARNDGVDLPELPDYESMRRFVEGGHCRVEVTRPWLIGQLLQSIDFLLPLLASRHWSLLVAQLGCDFITSDSPVAVSWSHPQPPSVYGPAFGLARTDVTFPLSRRLALVGRFEGRPAVLPADRSIVAAVNHRTGSRCERVICSPCEDFPWPRPDGTVGTSADLIAAIQERTQKSASGDTPR